MNISNREIEPADIRAIYEQFTERACATFNKRKECPPQLALVALGEQPGDVAAEMFIDSNLVNELQRNARSKDALMKIIRFLLANPAGLAKFGIAPMPMPPAAVVHVTEMWMLKADHAPGEDRDKAGNFADHPERREAILVAVHTRERSYPGVSFIEGTGDNRIATAGPFLEGMTGRLTVQDGQPGDGTH